MAARRPWGWHGLRHLQHCHNEGSGSPAHSIEVLSGTLLTETEMWRSQSWKCHFDLGIYLKAQIRSAWDMQLCGCRTLMIHSSPRSPPYRQARNWLGQVITSNPHTHVFFLWNPKSGREWKVTTQLGVPMAQSGRGKGNHPGWGFAEHSHTPP